jgi:acetyl-CoA decarbonylase/synthase complex subunit gamma
MALSGIQIFKLLPKTNCKECGFPTCLAFAMQLALGKVELAKCPHVSDEAKAQLQEASAPPIRTVVTGKDKSELKIGGETVLFRHDKTFVNPTGIAILITDAMEDGEIDGRIKKIETLAYERVGLILKSGLVFLEDKGKDSEKYLNIIDKIKTKGDIALILASKNKDLLSKALEKCKDIKPIVYAAEENNAEDMGNLAKQYACPLAVKAETIEKLSGIVEKLTALGINDLVLDSGARDIKTVYRDQIAIRRAPLLAKFKPLGFPTITFPSQMTDDYMKEALYASILIAKYTGIIVLSDFKGETLFPLLVERLNIYTDPQRPMMVKEGIYEIGQPNDASPVLVTTNFALTYFVVSGEVENSRKSAWLLVQDTEGLSVLTAWAADKFVAETIGALVKKIGIVDKVKHRKLIIPGYVASILGELEEELPDWEILLGPREAATIPAYLKQWQT